jgi:hypothetical protein
MSPLPGSRLSIGAQAVMTCGVDATCSPNMRNRAGTPPPVAFHVILMPPYCPTGTLSNA